MADEQHPYADPWGLPAEETPDALAPTNEPEEVAEVEDAVSPPEITPDISDDAPTTEDAFERVPEGETISPAQMEAKNVLETLGAGIEDLPEEPPDWVEGASTPKVYQELSDLSATDVEVPAVEAVDEEAAPEGFEEIGDEDTEDTTDVEVPTVEAVGEEVEPHLDEAVTSALSAFETPESDLVEPIEESIDQEVEPDLDEAVASALSAFETPESDFAEPAETETDLDETVASALSAIETPESDLVEPIEESIDEEVEPDLDEVVASALSAFETPESDLVEPIEESIDQEAEPDLDETVASALSAIGTPASDLVEPIEESIDEKAQPSDVSHAESDLVESPTVAWGSAWSSAAQGWVRQEDGRSTWRPIVTTTSDVGAWQVDTFLGIVSGDATISDAGNLAGARRTALQALVDEALARGAHAVVGVRTSVLEVGRNVVFTAVGTAVTLRNPS